MKISMILFKMKITSGDFILLICMIEIDTASWQGTFNDL